MDTILCKTCLGHGRIGVMGTEECWVCMGRGTLQEEECKMKYFGLYDTQIGGFKSGIGGTYEETLEGGLDRVWLTHQDWFESSEDGLETFEEVQEHYNYTDEDMIALFDYEIREVSEEECETIIHSDEVGLTTSVQF